MSTSEGFETNTIIKVSPSLSSWLSQSLIVAVLKHTVL